MFAPFAAIVPTVAFPPATPFTLQATLVSGLPEAVTLAVNTCAPPVARLTVPGKIVITMSSIKLTPAEALACEFASLTASTVTFAGDGRWIRSGLWRLYIRG